MIKTEDIISKIESYASLDLAEDWDNSGWQINLGNKTTKKIILTLDVTPTIVDEAIKKGCDLIIHDAQYSTEDYLRIYVPKQGFGHSTFEMALDCKKQIEAKQIVFFHYDPCYNDEKLDLLAEEYADENAIMAREGLEINLL